MASNIFNNEKKSSYVWVNLLIHLSVILLIVLPEFITDLDNDRPVPVGVIIKMGLFLSIFYANYFFINRFLDHKKGKWLFCLHNLLIFIVASGIILLTSHGYSDKNFHPIVPPPHLSEEMIDADKSLLHQEIEVFNDEQPPHLKKHNSLLHAVERLTRDFFIIILIIALAFAIKVTTRWLKDQRRYADLIILHRETELENLKSQINPHFLFNTLNSIYALIMVNPTQAQKAVHELSAMMRYAIYETSQKVLLQQEISFLKSYIALMKMRMNEKRNIEVSLEYKGYSKYEIAPLLFIPIIENAFKYGNTVDVSLPIKISLIVNEGIVNCQTFNYFDAKNKKEKKDSGVGLENLQRRLNLVYGKNATLKTTKKDNTFKAELNINLN